MSTAERMQALQIVAPGRVEMIETGRPDPGPGEVLVRVEAVTTCPQWDLHIMGGDPMFPGVQNEYPQPIGQPGHEAVGVVAALGPDVDGLTIGTRVAAWCDPGHDVPGAYAQYVVRTPDQLLEVPGDLSVQSLASLELAMCVRVSFEALRQNVEIAGRRIGIAGLGCAGLVAVQLARAEGAGEVVGYDLSADRREQALALGADTVLDPREVAPVENRETGDDALDAAVDCAGNAQSVQFLMDRTRHAVALFGVLRDEVRYGWRHFGGLALLGYRPHHRAAAEAALAEIVAGRLDLRPLVTETLPLGDYERGLALLREQRALKICFEPSVTGGT
jgi:threonine dehydrogenase-like Zn-dependent dehydrogenase